MDLGDDVRGGDCSEAEAVRAGLELGADSKPDCAPEVTGVPDAPNSVCAAATGSRFAGADAVAGADEAGTGAAGRRVATFRRGDTTS